jgi:hypothetical protein
LNINDVPCQKAFVKVELLKWLVEGLVVEHDSLEEGMETELHG